jgi:hypothetical protein
MSGAREWSLWFHVEAAVQASQLEHEIFAQQWAVVVARDDPGPIRIGADKEMMMAKALYGHVGGAPDQRLLDEVARLRTRVRDLEIEVMRLRAENDRLVAAAANAEDLLHIVEPALA